MGRSRAADRPRPRRKRPRRRPAPAPPRPATPRRFLEAPPPEDLGLAEHLVFPFLALVGQYEMKLALLLTVINPFVGGVLLPGPRGTGKTTAARSLADLLPDVPRSRCTYGCLPEDIETGGLDAGCPGGAQGYGGGGR